MTEKSFRNYIKKIKWGQQQTMPMCQGEAIKAVINEYQIPAKQWGYWMDVIGVETNRQIILWRDTGVGVQFIGLLNKDKNTIELSKSEPKQEHKLIESMKQLQKEIRKRDYDNIKGLRAKITEKEYDYYLGVLPPMAWKGNTFYLREFLSGDLTYKFSQKGKSFYCEIADFREEQSELVEKQESGKEV